MTESEAPRLHRAGPRRLDGRLDYDCPLNAPGR